MKTYRVLFKPLEPYFFGNEKSFAFFDPQTNTETTTNYHIKSEPVMSQSTVLGALRYLFLPVKKADWSYSPEETQQNAEAVGVNSFMPERKDSFGKIESISPIFLYGPKGIYVPTPFDHQNGNETYRPLEQFLETETPEGKRLVSTEYNTKMGIANSYMALADGTIISNDVLFTPVIQKGINTSLEFYGFFKREMKKLHDDFFFGVYVTVQDDLAVPHQAYLFAGQKKSAFSVTFTEEENNIEAKVKAFLRDDVVYCFGDAFTEASIYEKSLFSITKIKTYRSFTGQNQRVTKGAVLHRLIRAGSVFIPYDKEGFLSSVRNENTETIGYNNFITK